MTIQNFIKRRPYLIWHTKSYHNLSEASVVEAVLNHGSWDDAQEIIRILGIKKTADIFRKKSSQKRCNYAPQIKNYFNLYFKKNA